MKTYLSIFLLTLSIFLLIANGRFSGDGLQNYLTAESIFLDKDLAIHDRPFAIKEMRVEKGDLFGKDNKIYSPYGIGMPALLLPLYILGHSLSGLFRAQLHDYITNFTVSLFNPICIASSVAMLFSILRHLGYKLKTALYTVFAYAFSSMVFIYVRSGFSDPALALMYLGGALYLLKFKMSKKISHLVISSLFIAYSVLIKKNAAIVLPVYLGYIFSIFYREKKQALKYVVLFVLPYIVALGVIIGLNFLIFGSVLQTEHGGIAQTLKKALPGHHFTKGLYYYIFSSGKGFFFYNLPLIFSLFGIAGALKKYKKEALFVLSLVIVHFLFYAHIFKRGSLFCWGPRYLLPTVPFMFIFFAEYIAKSFVAMRKKIVILVVTAGFLIQFPALFINFSNFIYFVKAGLGIDEYLINFVPDLSPIGGSWRLFTAFFAQIFLGRETIFTFNPDYILVAPRSAMLSPYYLFDIWWLNAARVDKGLTAYIFLALAFLIFICLLNLRTVHKIEKES